MSLTNVVVRPLSAQRSSKRLFSSWREPYCVVSCRGRTASSATAHQAGSTPAWASILTFPALSTDTLKVQVRGRNRFRRDKLIGEAFVPLLGVFQQGTQRASYALYKNGRSKGHVLLDLSLDANGFHGATLPQVVYPQTVYTSTVLPAPVYQLRSVSPLRGSYLAPSLAQSYAQTTLTPVNGYVGPALQGSFHPVAGALPPVLTTTTSRVYSYTSRPGY